MEQLEQKDLGRNSRCSLVSVGDWNGTVGGFSGVPSKLAG
jgi:hypothetical protein